jgi:acyl-CoA synthetase (AMP-forming)/AMP-acid ligase II
MLNVLPLYHIFSFVGGSTVGAILGIPNIYPAPGFNSNLSIKGADFKKWLFRKQNSLIKISLSFIAQ